MSKKTVKQKICTLKLGDLIRLEWHDASRGEARVDKKRRGLISFDIPVTSWGVFLGVLGSKVKHVVLVRDHFQMPGGVFDIDFNVIPLGMVADVSVLKRGELSQHMAEWLKNAFLQARIRTRKGRIHLQISEGLMQRINVLPSGLQSIFWNDLETAAKNRVDVLERHINKET